MPYICLTLWDKSGYSLSIGLKLADLKQHHQIMFRVAGARMWTCHGLQLGGRHYVKTGFTMLLEKRKRELRADTLLTVRDKCSYTASLQRREKGKLKEINDTGSKEPLKFVDGANLKKTISTQLNTFYFKLNATKYTCNILWSDAAS